MRFFHISDIHFNYKNFQSMVLRNRLLKYIEDENIKANAIIVTGDCMYQYGDTEECTNFLEDLRKHLGCKKNNIFICPGNHDIDRFNIKRNEKIEDIRKTKEDITDSIYKNLIKDGYDRFIGFHREVTNRKYRHYEVIKREKGVEKYRIISLNSCLLSKDDEDEKQLRVCCDELENIYDNIHNDEFVNILIMHHSIEYLHEEDILKFQHWLDDNHIDIVLCGHSHRGDIKVLSDTKYDIKQFVCGAMMLDNFTIPSFLIYDVDFEEFKTNIKLYTFSNDEWGLGNSHLRKFRNGEYKYKLERLFDISQNKKQDNSIGKEEQKNNLDKLNIAEMAFLNELDKKIFDVYERKIISARYDSLEDFSTDKILCSLLKIGMPFDKSLKVAEAVVNTLSSAEYRKKCFGELTTEKIRDEVYYTICRMVLDNGNNSDVNEWAGKYARRYGHNNLKLMIVDADTVQNPISIKYISDTIIKDMFYKATGSNECYEGLLRKEINKIAVEILEFLKECNAYFLDYNKLIDFLMEIASEMPHPYIIVDKRRNSILKYHKEKVEKHLIKLKNEEAEHVTILEELYHSSALIVTMYSNVTGFLETSPITILNQSISKLGIEDEKTPISKIHMYDLKKDMGVCDISWKKFVYLVYDICASDIMKNTLIKQNNVIIPKLIMFAEISLKMYDNYKNRNINSIGKLEDLLPVILSKGEGFVVKNPVKKQSNCFWLTTNWKRNVLLTYGLKEQIFIVVTQDIQDDLNKAKKYLREKTDNCGETIWIRKDGIPFSDENKKFILSQFNEIGINAYFLDQKILENWSNSNVRHEMFVFLTKE